jgi:hypothetical protein
MCGGPLTRLENRESIPRVSCGFLKDIDTISVENLNFTMLKGIVSKFNNDKILDVPNICQNERLQQQQQQQK